MSRAGQLNHTNKDSSVSEFLSQLSQIPWFENLGQPIDPAAGVPQIGSWDEWPGPEDPGAMEMGDRHQALHDELMSSAGDQATEATNPWNQIKAYLVNSPGQVKGPRTDPSPGYAPVPR